MRPIWIKLFHTKALSRGLRETGINLHVTPSFAWCAHHYFHIGENRHQAGPSGTAGGGLSGYAGGVPLAGANLDSKRDSKGIATKSNCLESQEEWPSTVGVRSHQGERCLSMELRITSSLRMQAVRANFFGLPAASSRW